MNTVSIKPFAMALRPMNTTMASREHHNHMPNGERKFLGNFLKTLNAFKISIAITEYSNFRNKNATRSPQNDSHHTLDRKLDSSEQLDIASGCLTPVRSITEIYRSAETRLQKLIANQPDDNNSESSIEGNQKSNYNSICFQLRRVLNSNTTNSRQNDT